MKISCKKVYFSLAVFSAVFLFGLAISIPSSSASAENSKVYYMPQKKAKSTKLKVSVKNKTKKSSIKLTGTTGAYFKVIISVNGQEKTTLTANKKGAFKFNVPLDSAVNTVSVRAFNGTITQTVIKNITRTSKQSTSKVERINSASSYYPVFSPDGNYIVYTNGSDGNKLYKKSFNDSSNGQPINNISSFDPSFSPDGNYIIYRSGDDAFLYKKSANDSGNGEKINDGLKGDRPVYSPDGQGIYYVSISNLQIYKKNLSDNSIGEQITSSANPYALAISPDGLYLIYSNLVSGCSGCLYKKDTNDTSNGALITSNSFPCSPDISPSGGNVIYAGDSQQVRIKKLNESGNGELVKTGNKNEILKARYDVVYSPNGEYIVYVNPDNKYLYKKKL